MWCTKTFQNVNLNLYFGKVRVETGMLFEKNCSKHTVKKQKNKQKKYREATYNILAAQEKAHARPRAL